MGFAGFICRNVLFTYLVAHMVKNLPVVQETWVQSLGQGDCLENSIDGGVWWATVHGVTKSETQLTLSRVLFKDI